ncbi:hypothetical protein VCO01S_32230 [Vibrio comitans NBRC 102076]|uniref:Uncharacterized protein n=1 Tax=Vibrio comitans NBRC 102076 TaxID=1219078 RepID=A0A4Y3ITG5_9VIBR|nr:hypothetical protein VCO01S_32230 [Vibrio comitans NBRC 102076]
MFSSSYRTSKSSNLINTANIDHSNTIFKFGSREKLEVRHTGFRFQFTEVQNNHRKCDLRLR